MHTNWRARKCTSKPVRKLKHYTASQLMNTPLAVLERRHRAPLIISFISVRGRPDT